MSKKRDRIGNGWGLVDMLPVPPATEDRASSVPTQRSWHARVVGLTEIPLLQHSVSVCWRAEVIIMQAPSTLQVCEMHALSFRREFCCLPILRLC